MQLPLIRLEFTQCCATEKVFVSASGQNWFSGNIEDVAIKEKDKFPKDYFPDVSWFRCLTMSDVTETRFPCSVSGLVKVSWGLDGVSLVLRLTSWTSICSMMLLTWQRCQRYVRSTHVCLTLKLWFQYPSYYTKVRRDALQYTLDRVETDEFEKVPFFLFGDFNFRLNTGSVIKVRDRGFVSRINELTIFVVSENCKKCLSVSCET